MAGIAKSCLLATLLLLLALPVQAQRMIGPPDFSPQNLMTVRGPVVMVQEQSGPGPGGVQHKVLMLTLKTETGLVAVHLGPPQYFQQQRLTFKEGEVLEVTGARMTTPGGLMLLATQVKQGDKVIKLRDEQGNPVWMGQRLGRPKQP